MFTVLFLPIQDSVKVALFYHNKSELSFVFSTSHFVDIYGGASMLHELVDWTLELELEGMSYTAWTSH